MSVYIEQVISGELDLTQAFSKKHFRHTRTALPIPGQVLVDNNASNLHTVIEVTGRDRTGFLYQVTSAIADLGLSIATAHISTYGAQAADVFYVKDLFGMKIDHEGKLRIIKETLLDVIS
jgi:[protein-PII] uridylyltransferase